MAPSPNVEIPSEVDAPMVDVNGEPATDAAEDRADQTMTDYQDTPDYTDSDTHPNTTASSVAGDLAPIDGRKRRSEAFQLRKKTIPFEGFGNCLGSPTYFATS
ncbi:hypothetical protein CIHG_02397 [Coccidioides immitis H538.4]|uniref:Uncharacterized protein n=1 Tax=Coccidioides immitis H538.4 TaxID=396776 RepID=A0A0J8UBU6_COCIT|nr:hypothetical protein CIHG_02397 [Coccidioides immitis H538.4]